MTPKRKTMMSVTIHTRSGLNKLFLSSLKFLYKGHIIKLLWFSTKIRHTFHLKSSVDIPSKQANKFLKAFRLYIHVQFFMLYLFEIMWIIFDLNAIGAPYTYNVFMYMSQHDSMTINNSLKKNISKWT